MCVCMCVVSRRNRVHVRPVWETVICSFSCRAGRPSDSVHLDIHVCLHWRKKMRLADIPGRKGKLIIQELCHPKLDAWISSRCCFQVLFVTSSDTHMRTHSACILGACTLEVKRKNPDLLSSSVGAAHLYSLLMYSAGISWPCFRAAHTTRGKGHRNLATKKEFHGIRSKFSSRILSLLKSDAIFIPYVHVWPEYAG